MPREARSLRVQAIVLKHSDFGEADRLLTVYTRELGKLRAIAKGARKPRSRKGGHVEPFSDVSLQLAKGSSLYIVSQAEVKETHSILSENLVALSYASYVVELLDKFTYDEDVNPGLFRLLRDTLGRLASDADAQMVVRYYELRLLDLLGFRPELQQCLICEKRIQPEDQYFSIQKGGVLCPECGRHEPGADPISMQALKYLRHFQRSAYDEAARASLPESVKVELETLMDHYLTYLLERSLNSPRFLRQVRRDAQQAD
ncbi:MAG: DNA repair protein RecO [Chloroflexi bacterium]|nr:DNA repair protein RecO [Chloroflexota bacterium]MQC26359.1 DNA repair protein RecO [Chloroflexota bacterium]